MTTQPLDQIIKDAGLRTIPGRLPGTKTILDGSRIVAHDVRCHEAFAHLRSMGIIGKVTEQ